jgi:glycosyltransferase involved in cell wall biosynthesis
MLVSVILITRNRAALLSRAIDSVLAQSYPHIELIVVDDGSEDEILEIYSKKFSNIITSRHPSPRGGNAARNTGLKLANGEYVAGLDDDDEFLPMHVDALLAAQGEQFSFVCARSMEIGYHGRKQTRFVAMITYHCIMFSNAVGNQVLVSRSKILAVGGYDEKLTRYQDYDMWVRLIREFGPAKCLNLVTQNIYSNHAFGRKSDSRSVYRGASTFYRKHKKSMTRIQRQVQLFPLLKHRGTKLRFLLLRAIAVRVVLSLVNFRSSLSAFMR